MPMTGAPSRDPELATHIRARRGLRGAPHVEAVVQHATARRTHAIREGRPRVLGHEHERVDGGQDERLATQHARPRVPDVAQHGHAGEAAGRRDLERGVDVGAVDEVHSVRPEGPAQREGVPHERQRAARTELGQLVRRRLQPGVAKELSDDGRILAIEGDVSIAALRRGSRDPQRRVLGAADARPREQVRDRQRALRLCRTAMTGRAA